MKLYITQKKDFGEVTNTIEFDKDKLIELMNITKDMDIETFYSFQDEIGTKYDSSILSILYGDNFSDHRRNDSIKVAILKLRKDLPFKFDLEEEVVYVYNESNKQIMDIVIS